MSDSDMAVIASATTIITALINSRQVQPGDVAEKIREVAAALKSTASE